MIRGRHVVAGVTAAVALLAVAVMPAVAAATLTVSPPSGAPGQVLHAIGSGFSADQQIKLQWDAGFLPEAGTSDSSGAFDIPFAIPTVATLGGHVLRACIRGVCSQAVPFTVSVVAGTPPPVSTPVPSASAASSVSPEPSNQSSEPSPGVTPSGSAAPSNSAAPTTSESPLPAASASSVIGPTVAPTALPAEPGAPGTIKVKFPWDRIAIAGIFGLGVLLIVVAAANEKWLKGTGGKVFDRESAHDLAAGSDAPSAGKAPKRVPPGIAPGHGGPADVEASTEAKPALDATKDVKLKGKNIKEN